jgi:hypothetical protein
LKVQTRKAADFSFAEVIPREGVERQLVRNYKEYFEELVIPREGVESGSRSLSRIGVVKWGDPERGS